MKDRLIFYIKNQKGLHFEKSHAQLLNIAYKKTKEFMKQDLTFGYRILEPYEVYVFDYKQAFSNLQQELDESKKELENIVYPKTKISHKQRTRLHSIEKRCNEIIDNYNTKIKILNNLEKKEQTQKTLEMANHVWPFDTIIKYKTIVHFRYNYNKKTEESLF